MPWQLYETLVFTKQEAGWQPEPAWIPQTRGQGEGIQEILTCQESDHDSSVGQPVA